MIGLLQRVSSARVEAAERVLGSINHGLLVLVCAEPTDGPEQVRRFVDKVLKLRIFADDQGRMNRSVVDVAGALLFVSQFTLAADVSGGNRPGFTAAAPGELGRRCYESVLSEARARHARVEAGEFGAHMQVHLVNDGPVTIPLRIT